MQECKVTEEELRHLIRCHSLNTSTAVASEWPLPALPSPGSRQDDGLGETQFSSRSRYSRPELQQLFWVWKPEGIWLCCGNVHWFWLHWCCLRPCTLRSILKGFGGALGDVRTCNSIAVANRQLHQSQLAISFAYKIHLLTPTSIIWFSKQKQRVIEHKVLSTHREVKGPNIEVDLGSSTSRCFGKKWCLDPRAENLRCIRLTCFGVAFIFITLLFSHERGSILPRSTTRSQWPPVRDSMTQP